ncbi:recombinase family protein [Cryobacterium glaciale]|uniref:recombinase family protein n=1 Tax=Cryobacterium glaciale TaxID=1259145 RepID=UPI003B96E7DB
MQVDALVKSGVQERDIFADVTSGSRTAIFRPGMKKLLDYAKPGDTVVVWRVDRLGRSLIDVLNTVKLLRERDVQVKSVSDGIDPSTTSGRLMLNMLATLAGYERELITERVNAGITAALARETGIPARTLQRWNQLYRGGGFRPSILIRAPIRVSAGPSAETVAFVERLAGGEVHLSTSPERSVPGQAFRAVQYTQQGPHRPRLN